MSAESNVIMDEVTGISESQINDCVDDFVKDKSALIVAFASQEGDMVDQHFGSAQAFFAYSVTQDNAELIASKQFGYEKKDGNEDKLKPKLKWLVGADIVYCGSVGGSATKQLISLGVTPKKVTGGPDVEDLLEELYEQLKAVADGSGEFWLESILKKKQGRDENRFDDMEDEGWEE